MTTKTRLLPFLAWFCFASIAMAQKPKSVTPSIFDFKECGTHKPITPQAILEAAQLENFTRDFIKKMNKDGVKRATYTIPVVFHIYGEVQNGYTVTTQKIIDHLNELNRDFVGANPEFSTVESFFLSRRTTLSIEYKLAKIDQWGGATNGIVFYPWAKKGYALGGTYDADIAADAWDNNKYMNIYIQPELYANGETNDSGYATYPNESAASENIGKVVYNGRYLLNNDPSRSAGFFHKTLTHEFGHNLNLFHTFEDGCADGDGVADTPAEDGNHTLRCTPGTNCSGGKVNIENYMGYNGSSGCYKMFTRGQVDRMLAALSSPSRINLWQSANLNATGVNLSSSVMTAEKSVLQEANSNDGSFSSSRSIVTITGSKTLAFGSGSLVNGTHFTHNFPSGLTPVLTVNNNKQLTLTISGRASSHAVSNTTRGTITFTSAAFSGGTSGLNASSLNFKLRFRDPYTIVYENITDVTSSASNTFSGSFRVSGADASDYYATQLFKGDYNVESYGKKVVCNSGTRDVTVINAGALISSSSNWVGPVDPNANGVQPILKSPSYSSWDGRTAYFGFQVNKDGEVCYGWMRLVVAPSGTSFTITEYAYNTQPGGSITAGQTTGGAVIPPSTTTVATPSGLTATASGTSIALRWTDNSSNETSFIIQRATGGGSYANIATLGTNVTSYTDSGLTSGTTYSYIVRAANVSASSNWSNVASATAGSTTPPSSTSIATPSGMTATASGTTVSLRWTDNANNETFNIVQRATGTSGTFANIASLGGNVTTYSDAGLSSGTTYKYRVRAASSTASSDWSNEATVTIGSGTTTTTLPAPTGVRADVFSDQFYAVWGTVTGATGYEVELIYGTTTTINVVAGGSSYFYLVRQIGSNLSYKFRVRATNGTGKGAWSNQITVNLAGAGPTGRSLENTKEIKFLAFPNPVTDNVQFQFSNPDASQYQMSIFSADGKLVDKFTGVNSYNVSHLHRGLYQIIAKDADGHFEKTTIIKL